MGKIYSGEIGLTIELKTFADLSAATKTEIKYSRPDGTTGVWPGTVKETSITYTTISGDLAQAGNWKLQAYAEGPGYAVLGETVYLDVSVAWS